MFWYKVSLLSDQFSNFCEGEDKSAHMWLVVGLRMTKSVFCILCIFVFFYIWSQVVYPYLCFTCFCVFLAFLSSVAEFTFYLVHGIVWLWVFLLCYFQCSHVFYVFSCFSLIFYFNVTARVLCVFVFLCICLLLLNSRC